MPTGETTTAIINGKERKLETFTLRKGGDYHRHILAITFTNKATNEMKERIVKELYLLGQGKGKYINDFKIMFPASDIDEVATMAQKALGDILFDYGTFNVSTIDSFFQSILRNFAREIDRDYSYDLELDDDYATGVAVHDFLLDLGGRGSKQATIDQWVREFIKSNINNNHDWNFFGRTSDLQNFAKIMFKEFFRDHYQEVIKYLDDIGSGSGKSRINKFKEQLVLRKKYHENEYNNFVAQHVKNFFDSHNIPASDIKKGNLVGYFYNGTPVEFSGSQKDTFKKYATEPDALARLVLNKPSKDDVSQADCEEFQKLMGTAHHHYTMMRLLDGAIHNIWNLGLLGKINEKLEQYRKDTNTILIADTNELIGKVLGSGATFIYEHAGSKLNNYMIDEFQDTSHKQYDNFKPLLEESISRGMDNMIIGDEKQSIYRFRNSDPSMLRDEIGRDFASASESSLDTNYRSLDHIVKFNNNFFVSLINDYRDNAPQFQSLIKTYNNIDQETGKIKDERKGFIAINFVEKVGSKDEYHQAIIKTLPNYINTLRQQGYGLSDIAILVNKRSEGNEIVEHLLKHNNSLAENEQHKHINIISSESLLLNNSPQVRLIVSALQFLDNTQYKIPDDDENNEDNDEFNKFLKRRIALQQRHKIMHDFHTSLQNVVTPTNAGEVLLQCFEKDRANNKQLNERQLLNLYSDIAQEVMPDKHTQLTNLVNIVDKIIAKYILPSAQVENAFLMAFMNVVLDFSRQHNGGTVREFLKFWDTKKSSLAVASPDDADAVNVMTIHKSKGLEFKCVILPFVDWDLMKMDDIFWINKKDWLNCKTEDAKCDESSNNKALEGIGSDDDTIVPPLVPLPLSKMEEAGLFISQLNEERERCLIDNINKLYVAFTRPKEELHIFAPFGKKDSIENYTTGITEIKTANQLLLKFIPQMPDFSPCERDLSHDTSQDTNSHPQGSQNDEQESCNATHVFSYLGGSPCNPIIDDKNDDDDKPIVDVATMPTYNVSAMTKRVHVSMHGASGSIMKEGLRMHELMSMINSVDDIDNAITYAHYNNLFKSNSYWTIKRVKTLLDSLSTDATLSQWFASGNIVYNEREISFPHSATSNDKEHRRPDRIIRRPSGELIVIDYKFGFKHDASTVAKHKEQVKEYITLLRQLGENNVQGYVWYVRNNKIVEVNA